MNILAFDTCFSACSVAVGTALGTDQARGDGLFEARETGHAEVLFPMIKTALANAGIAMRDLDRLAVTIGPGTFTGARIGIAAARGLALAAGLPVVAATSLAVMAYSAVGNIAISADGDFLVAVDARRGAVYAQLFARDGTERSPPLLLSPSDAAVLGTGPIVIVGSGAEAVAAEAAASGRSVSVRLTTLLPDARALLPIAQRLKPLPAPPSPLYLREADAKPQGGAALARA